MKNDPLHITQTQNDVNSTDDYEHITTYIRWIRWLKLFWANPYKRNEIANETKAIDSSSSLSAPSEIGNNEDIVKYN